jgi:hypothetical protein
MVVRHDFETLSSTADKEADQRNQSHAKWHRGTARGTSWILFFGAAAGAAVGVLNLAATANDWRLQDLFDVLDVPGAWVMDAVRERFDFLAGAKSDAIALYALLSIIGYWTIVGLLAASVFCIVRLLKRRMNAK